MNFTILSPMLDFIMLAHAIRVIYNHAKDKIMEEDFFDLPAKAYQKLQVKNQSRTWYMLNPGKIKTNEAFIADEQEKQHLLNAVNFIKKASAELPQSASFLERLLYTKKFIPPVLFSKQE